MEPCVGVSRRQWLNCWCRPAEEKEAGLGWAGDNDKRARLGFWGSNHHHHGDNTTTTLKEKAPGSPSERFAI